MRTKHIGKVLYVKDSLIVTPSVSAVCAAGYGSNNYDVTSCMPCSIGTFKARAELTPCEPCGPGTKNTQEGSTSCDRKSYHFAFWKCHSVELSLLQAQQ